MSGAARIYKDGYLVISGCHNEAPTDVEIGESRFSEKYQQGILGSKLNGKHKITALEDRTSDAAGEVNANRALGSSDEIFARILVPDEYWHNPGGQPSQAAAGTDLACHQIDMMCCVDVQRRFGDIDWEASFDILVLPEKYPGGPLPGKKSRVICIDGFLNSSIPVRIRNRGIEELCLQLSTAIKSLEIDYKNKVSPCYSKLSHV